MRAVTGVVQHYAWGDHEAIPRLLGDEPDGRPWAELWFGTHPAGPARLADGRPLREISGDLPYLLKVLAAASTLSLQTHPSDEQAARGYALEQRHGPPLDAPDRLYRDPLAKPELLCALTPFDALCGFRPVAASVALLHSIGATGLAAHLETGGIASTVRKLYHRELPLDAVLDACRRAHHREARLVVELATLYPGDPSVAVTLLLNRVTLAPGEAIFLGPGNLHAYLHGTGVELMGASDNVIRGGLTVKHVDANELLSVLDVRPLDHPVVVAVEEEPGCWRYDTPPAPFTLRRFDVDGLLTHTASGREVLLCTDGHTDLLPRGTATYLEPDEVVHLSGRATVFCAQESGAG